MKACPQIIQISDVVPLQLNDGAIAFLRVIMLEYLCDTTFYRRVLDIEDDDIAKKVLPERIKVTDMTFNECKGYLCHAESLEKVDIFDSEDSLGCGSSSRTLPKNTL